MTDLTLVELFAGIGGFSCGFEQAGAKTVAAVEIDPAARQVFANHFPDAVLFDDVTKVCGDDLRAVGFVPERGVLTGGWPCQGNSVAGQRAGLQDSRSGLWSEIYRLLNELKPAWFVGENVTGLLSVNDGKDIRLILTDLNNLGYFVNLDLLDASDFGVPQRRRRLFFVCHRADLIVEKKTISSALIISQCLTEILVCILVAAQQRSPTGFRSSVSHLSKSSVDGLKMRMTLFGLDADVSNWLKLANSLEEASQKYLREQENLESPPGKKGKATSLDQGIGSLGMTASEKLRLSNTGLSWNSIWADLSQAARLCITSTPTNWITESKIYSCALIALNISERIVHWTNSSQDFLNAKSSVLTALKEFTNYAKQATSELFGELAWNDRWDAFIREAERAIDSFGHFGDGGRCSAEVLFESEGLCGDFASGGEAAQEVTGEVAAGAGICCGSAGLDISSDTHTHTHTCIDASGRRETRLPDRRRSSSRGPSHCVAALTANGVGTCGADDNQAQAGHLIAQWNIHSALREVDE